MKKKVLLILWLALIMFVGIQKDAYAQEIKTYENFTYTYMEQEGVICIKKYVGNEEEVVVPAQIDGKPVCYMGEVFSGNKRIRKVILPEGIKVVSGFDGCSKLQEVNIPASTIIIDTMAFYNCKLLKKIDLPEGLQEIGDFAFEKCISLKKIQIPDSVKVIEQAAFYGCSGLTKVKLPASITKIDWETFKGCKKIKSITIPEGVKRIEDKAFAGCNALKKIKLPNSLKVIGYMSFNRCAMKEITIPKNVTSIGSNCFLNCKKLKKINIKSSKLKSIGVLAFCGVYKKAVFDVPNKCIKKYTEMIQGIGAGTMVVK